jgi:FtsP/CotA-like multicopper oxidase with cupredoxin domain
MYVPYFSLETCRVLTNMSTGAIAPGDTKNYIFKATEYGTSWYHSHFSGQYGDGVIGTIQINGPATANYDIDLGTYTLSDWYVKNQSPSFIHG